MFSKKLVVQRNVFKYLTAKIFKKFIEYWKKKFFNLVRPWITKKSTNWRQPIHAEVKLSVTLRYLATGETFESLMYQFRVHSSTIARFIPIVYQTIYNELQDIYFKNAIHRNRMGSDSTKNSRALTVPKLHRKNVGLAHPKDSGSDFFNYKSFFSIVLLALVGYDYKFIYLEAECQGRISDGGVYRNSSLCKVVVFI